MGFISQTNSAIGAPDLVLSSVPCDPTVTQGKWVIMVGGVAFLANADDIATSNVMGLCELKNTSTNINIRVLGVSTLVFSGLVEANQYYLTDDGTGNMTTNTPTDSGHVIVKLGQPFSPTQFLVLKNIVAIRG